MYIQEDNKKRKATADEVTQILKDQAEAAERARFIEAEQKAKEAARESAMAKLKAIGLTDDEISALVP